MPAFKTELMRIDDMLVGKDVLVLREAPAHEGMGFVRPEVKFSEDFRRDYQGQEMPIDQDGRVLVTGTLDFRGTELWLTKIRRA